MSLSTSYRYEAMTEKKSLKNALKRQHERIKLDETMAAREQQAKIENRINLKSEWNESLELVAARKKMQSNAIQQRDDLKLANKACIMVRRAALKNLLEREYQLYEQELHSMGKAFYIKRT